jgi:Lhr-like helicase
MIRLVNKHYETILRSTLSREEKDQAYTDLLKYMEEQYGIERLQKAEFTFDNRQFGADNRKIIALYQKISTSRKTNRSF